MNRQVSPVEQLRKALESHALSYDVELSREAIDRLSDYFALLSTWNARMHLVAPSPATEFATRHILESLLLLPLLPRDAAVADIGSGAGLPIIPCLVVRADLKAILVESSGKKAVFLREVLKKIERTASAKIIAARFQTVGTPDVSIVTCRALERLGQTLPSLVKWAPSGSTILLFGGEGLRDKIEHTGLAFSMRRIPRSERRFLFEVRRPWRWTGGT